MLVRSTTKPHVGAPIDANGNLTSDGTRTFEWDARNQLVAWTENSHRMEYSYDGFGRRTYAKELSGTATMAEKRFVWCGSSPCEDRQGPSWVPASISSVTDSRNSAHKIFLSSIISEACEM
jgi:hypothetical protein